MPATPKKSSSNNNPVKLIIGLTGGIGSGKSAASHFFQELGITVADSDLAARVVVEPGQPALLNIAQHFGAKVINPDGQLNRAELREIIFKDPTEKQWLETLLHPLIAAEIDRQLQLSDSLYTILASPLLLETEQWRKVDRVLAVDVSEELQLSRSCSRDGNTEAQINAIIAAQISRPERLKRSDDVIDNSGTIEHLHQQVKSLDKRYRQIAKSLISEKT